MKLLEDAVFGGLGAVVALILSPVWVPGLLIKWSFNKVLDTARDWGWVE